jgi:hypothetical protein
MDWSWIWVLVGIFAFAVLAGIHQGIERNVSGAGTAGQTCSDATLDGTYVFALQGSQVAFAGSHTYDGNGNVTSMATIGGQGDN